MISSTTSVQDAATNDAAGTIQVVAQLTSATDSNTQYQSNTPLSNLCDNHIIDTAIAGDTIEDATVSSISTMRTQSTATRTPPSTSIRSQVRRSPGGDALPVTNTSPVRTVEGAPLESSDNDTVVSVPCGSSQRIIDVVSDSSDNGYD